MPTLERAREVAGAVTDPELPVLTLADLGVLRSVDVDEDGAVAVTITPTYSGCPALGAMREDLVYRLLDAGFDEVRVEVALAPAWTTDWITDRGRDALRAAGLSPPGRAPRRLGPVPLTLGPVRRRVTCPRCGSSETRLVAEFAATACLARYACAHCLEHFDHVKEI